MCDNQVDEIMDILSKSILIEEAHDEILTYGYIQKDTREKLIKAGYDPDEIETIVSGDAE